MAKFGTVNYRIMSVIQNSSVAVELQLVSKKRRFEVNDLSSSLVLQFC